jgi:hypothetical protein
MVVEGTALLARLPSVLSSFSGDLVWDKRAGAAPARPITRMRRGSSICAPASQRNSRLRDLCAPSAGSCAYVGTPLSPGQDASDSAVLYIHCSRRCGWLCARLASPYPVTHSPHWLPPPWHRDIDVSVSSLDHHFACCRSPPPPTQPPAPPRASSARGCGCTLHHHHHPQPQP